VQDLRPPPKGGAGAVKGYRSAGRGRGAAVFACCFALRVNCICVCCPNPHIPPP
jgi:hypothetical protein